MIDLLPWHDGLLIQRPPVVKNLAVAVPLLREAWAGPHFFAAHPFEPLLALTVFGIFDIFACMQESPALKAPVHITPMGGIAGKLDNAQPPIRLFLPLPAAIPPPGLARVAWLLFRTLQKRRELLVSFDFCHTPSHRVQYA